MNNQTPLNEIYLTDTQLHILREFTLHVPEDFDISYIPLLDYGLLDYTPPHKQGSYVSTPKVAISIRGQQYLRYLDAKNHLLRLTEDSHTLNKKSYILNIIIVSVTLITLIYNIVSCVAPRI